jgi:hypothetical protein
MTRSLITGGSTTELSATDAWHRAVVGDALNISIITQDCQSATVQTGQIHPLDILNFKSGPRYGLARQSRELPHMQAQGHAHHASQPPAAGPMSVAFNGDQLGSAVLTDAEYLDKLIRAALTATKALLPEKVTSQEDDEPAD